MKIRHELKESQNRFIYGDQKCTFFREKEVENGITLREEEKKTEALNAQGTIPSS